MFENVVLCSSANTVKKFIELRDILAEDPVFKAYLTEDEGLKSLKEYVKSDAALSTMVQRVSNIMSMVESKKPLADSGHVDDFSMDELHVVISDINLLNGYNTALQSRDKFRTQYSKVTEVTEKTSKASMTEKVYRFMEERNYRDIKTDPRAQTLIHLAHLTEKMMDKLPELVRTSDLENAKKNMGDAKKKEVPTEFFDDLTQLEINCILDEKVLTEETKKNEEISKKNDDFLEMIQSGENKQFKGDFTKEKYDEARKKVLTLAEKNHPELLRQMKEKQEKAAIKHREIYDADLEDLVKKFRKDLVTKNNNRRENNELIEIRNEEATQKNLKIDGEILALKHEREEKRKDFEERKKKEEEFRRKQSDALKPAELKYEKEQKALTNQRKVLLEEVDVLRKYREASNYLDDKKNLPPQEHYTALAKLREKKMVLDHVRNIMYNISEDKRNATEAMELLTEKSIKTVDDLRGKLNKAVKLEQEAMDKLDAETVEKNKKSLRDKVEKAAKVREAAEKAFAPWKDAADLQDAIGKMWIGYPEVIKEEYIARKNKEPGRNAYHIFGDMVEDCEKKIRQELKKYTEFYKSGERMKDIAQLVISGKVRDVKELDKAEEELQDVETKLSKLVKPELDSDKMWEASKKIFDYDKDPDIMKEYEAATEAKIKKLETKRQELEDMNKVLSEKEIDEKVAAYEEEQKGGYLKTRHDSNLKEETEAIREATAKKLYDQGKADIFNESTRLRDKNKDLSKTVEMAKKKYNDAAEAFSMQEKIKGNYTKVKNKPLRFADMMEKELRSLSDNILKGTEKGHHDTKEFNRMKKSLSDAHQYLQSEENRRKLDALNEDSVNAFKKLLTTMKDESARYWTKKQTGIHWKPSNMRFVRLNMATRLQSTADEMSMKFDSLRELKTKENELQGQANTFNIKNPGKDYKAFTIANTSGAKKNENKAVRQIH